MPFYIYGLKSGYQPTVAQRSSSQNRLAVQLNITVLVSRAFQTYMYAPTIVNGLPKHPRDMVHTSGAQRAVDD